MRGRDTDLTIIAEIGVKNEGDPQATLRMIDAAAAAGADAVELQSRTPWMRAVASDPERLERVSEFAIDGATHRFLAAAALAASAIDGVC